MAIHAIIRNINTPVKYILITAFSRYPQKIRRLVSFAGQSYSTKEDMDKLSNVEDVSNWSERMRTPMETLYGKVCM